MTIIDETRTSAFDDLLARDDRPQFEASQTRDTGPPFTSPEQVREWLGTQPLTVALRGQQWLDQIQTLTSRIASHERQRELERREHDRWLGEIQDAAAEEAEQGDWCGEFEEFMESAGLESRRRRTETVTVTAWLCYEVDLEQHSETIVEHAIGAYCALDVDVQGTASFTVEVEAEVEVLAGVCACNEVNWGYHVPGEISHLDFDVDRVECGND